MTELNELKSFLDHDPENVSLRLDYAETAMAAGELEEAMQALLPLLETDNPKALSLKGMIKMRRGHYSEADAIFTALLETTPKEPGLIFNKAWTLAKRDRYQAALEILDDQSARSFPQAATLRVQLLHQLGRFDEAAQYARIYLESFADYPDLIGAASTIAMDISDPEWASQLSSLAPDHPDILITRATLDLSEATAKQSGAMFEQALRLRPDSARALIGKGLSELLLGETETASHFLDRGAEQFGTHLGSWIAAGWAHAAKGDWQTARARFEHAKSIDENFSEIHGSIAVLDIMEGNMEAGRKNVRTARRLDPDSASAALGQILILQDQGRADKAGQIFEKAMQMPIGDSGQTLAQAMIRMGFR